MDEALLDNINSKIQPQDKFYILGDFTLGRLEHVLEYRNRIRCKNTFLIQGNHDRLTPQQYQDAGFHHLGDIANVNIHRQRVTLCHWAMLRWYKSHRGAWHLFGHSHGKIKEEEIRRLASFDVGVDCHAYQPVSWEEVSERLRTKMAAIAPAPVEKCNCLLSLENSCPIHGLNLD